MIHEMNLKPQPFAMIAADVKTFELRLYDEKRRLVQIGDRIIFTNTQTHEQLTAEVIGLHQFQSFAQLYQQLPLERCGYEPEEVKAASPADMLEYYPEEKQRKYGVLAIEIRRID